MLQLYAAQHLSKNVSNTPEESRFYQRLAFHLPRGRHSVKALVDTGADANFIHPSLVSALGVDVIPNTHPINLELIDGSSGNDLTAHTIIETEFDRYRESLRYEISPLGAESVILGLPWMYRYKAQLDYQERTLLFDGSPSVGGKEPIAIVSAESFRRLAIKSAEIGILFNYGETLQIFSGSSSTISNDIEDINLNNVPEEFHEWKDVFAKDAANTLPEHRPLDHKIPIIEGQQPPYSPIYPLSQNELKVLKAYLDDMLAIKFIRPSQSPAAAPILFVKKKDGTLRLCVDYRGLNRVTVRDRYPLPLVGELLDRLSTARFFSKIDLRNAYHQIRIAEGDEWKTAFKTRYGLYEYRVMPFGLTNAPASFQHLVNATFHDMVDKYVIAYLDDIMIYSDTREEHTQHVKNVLQRLRESKLFTKPEKCEFYSDRVDFLGYSITKEGISMDIEKISSISKWPTPNSVTQVRSFLGFANFYRHFIKNYSKLALPLTDLTRKGDTFQWTRQAEEAFQELKRQFEEGDILRHFDPTKKIILETDASDFAIGAVLSQIFDGIIRPVAFFSRKLGPAPTDHERSWWRLHSHGRMSRRLERNQPPVAVSAMPVSNHFTH